MKAILIGVPRLLGELLRDAGMEVLADVATPDQALRTLEAISDDGTRATLYELRLHGTPLADMSPAAIVAVLSR